jgi:hypothetical protein
MSITYRALVYPVSLTLRMAGLATTTSPGAEGGTISLPTASIDWRTVMIATENTIILHRAVVFITSLFEKTASTLMLHTYVEKKRARVRQMWLRTDSDMSRRT